MSHITLHTLNSNAPMLFPVATLHAFPAKAGGSWVGPCDGYDDRTANVKETVEEIAALIERCNDIELRNRLLGHVLQGAFNGRDWRYFKDSFRPEEVIQAVHHMMNVVDHFDRRVAPTYKEKP